MAKKNNDVPNCAFCDGELTHDGGAYVPLFKHTVFKYSCRNPKCPKHAQNVHETVAEPGANYLKRRAFAALKDMVKMKGPASVKG